MLPPFTKIRKIILPAHTNRRLKVLKLKIVTLLAAKPSVYPSSLPQILYLPYLLPYLTLSTFSSHLPISLPSTILYSLSPLFVIWCLLPTVIIMLFLVSDESLNLDLLTVSVTFSISLLSFT